MGRSRRLDWNHAVHHVMARGIERTSIFKDDNDKAQFVSRIEKCVAQTGISIFAWALMPNHIHLLIQTCAEPLSKFMQKLLTGHAIYFNKKYGRVGHLFQNRYKSILVQADIYLLKLVRYIHINPLKAEIVSDYQMLRSYPWTGHPGLIHPGYYPWQETAQVLNTFSGNKTTKIDKYAQFIEETEEVAYQDGRFSQGSFLLGNKGLVSLNEIKIEEIGEHSQYRVLGDLEFASEIYRKLSVLRNGQVRDRRIEHDTVLKILEYAEVKWKIPRIALISKGRRRSVSRAREFICYTLVNVLGMSFVDSGKILNLSGQGVHAAAERFLPEYDYDKEIKKILN